jgi:hypothetical protein
VRPARVAAALEQRDAAAAADSAGNQRPPLRGTYPPFPRLRRASSLARPGRWAATRTESAISRRPAAYKCGIVMQRSVYACGADIAPRHPHIGMSALCRPHVLIDLNPRHADCVLPQNGGYRLRCRRTRGHSELPGRTDISGRLPHFPPEDAGGTSLIGSGAGSELFERQVRRVDLVGYTTGTHQNRKRPTTANDDRGTKANEFRAFVNFQR